MAKFLKPLILMICCSVFVSCSLFSRKKNSPPKEEPKKESVAAEETHPVQESKEEPSADADKDEAKHHPYHQVWGYSGVIGPDVWSELDPSFKLCKTGKKQSPIDLKWQRPKPNGKIELHYSSSPLNLIDNGHTLQVNFPSGNVASIRGKEYELVQLHFHSSSEHTLSGNSLPMEAHFVHKNDKGELAVLGVILIEGHHNPTLQNIWSHWPTAKFKEVAVSGATLNPEALIPTIKTHYAYEGSLTTPPCTEGVSWNVLNTPIELSREQILQFRDRYSSNNRPVQKLNGRSVTNY